MGKNSGTVNPVVDVHSPLGNFLYSVSLGEARAMMRSRTASRMNTAGELLSAIQLKTFDMPGWMGGTKYVRREFLPNLNATTCWAYSFTEIRSEDRDLFCLSVTDCMRSA